MRKTGRFVAVLAAAATAVTLATPALALGEHTESCATPGSYYGRSTTAGGAYTMQSASKVCGSVGARVRYENHPGSALYWTAWSTGSKSVTRAPQGNVVGGGHKVTDAGWLFKSSFTT